MTEFEIQALDLLRDIAGALAALNVGARREAGLVPNSRPHGVARWHEAEDQIFAVVVKDIVDLGLAESRLKTKELIAAVADRPVLLQAFAAIAAPVKGPADAIDPLRLGQWLAARECKGQAVMGWRLMADRRNINKPRWYLERTEGE